MIDAHDRISKHCSDPAGALEYIAGTVVTLQFFMKMLCELLSITTENNVDRI